MQQIVAQLLFDGADGLEVAEMSPWLDLRVPPKEVKLPLVEAQTHRRFIKTHLPVDALVYSPKAKYLYIGRDGRDVVWSMYNHHANANALWYELLNDTPGRVGPPIEPPPASTRDYFLDWLDRDGHPFWPFWENVRSLVGDPRAAERAAAALRRAEGRPAGPDPPHRRVPRHPDRRARFPAILEHCSFAYMKAHATKSVPLGGAFWDGGAATFINKGTNGRWRDVLTDADCRRTRRRRDGSWAKSAPAGSPAARAHRQKMPDRITAPCGSGRPSGPPRASRPARWRG